tara:strand:- start:1948 stop:2154 length:207 start_codon:yes stop_codon:yes gene_type:complete
MKIDYEMLDKHIPFKINEQNFMLRVFSSYKYDPKPHGYFIQVLGQDTESNQFDIAITDQIQIVKEGVE